MAGDGGQLYLVEGLFKQLFVFDGFADLRLHRIYNNNDDLKGG